MIEIGNTKIFDLEEIAKRFGLTPTTIRKYIKEGRISGQKMGNRWYISHEAIAEFFRQSYYRFRKST